MKTLAHISGGFDSAASALKVALNLSTNEFKGMFVDLGQPYLKQELKSAKYFSNFLTNRFPSYRGLEIVKTSMRLNSIGDSPSAYIPVRNMVIGSLSANLALSIGYNTIAVGSKTTKVRPDDPYSFSDCSVEFYKMMSEVSTFASENTNLNFIMPLVHDGGSTSMSKKDCIEFLISQKVKLSKLWSCYDIGNKPCGVCHHCQEIVHTGLSKVCGL